MIMTCNWTDSLCQVLFCCVVVWWCDDGGLKLCCECNVNKIRLMRHYSSKTARAHYKVNKGETTVLSHMRKLLKNSSVLSECLKVSNEGTELTGDASKPFQASAAAVGKARPPIVERRNDGVSSLSVAADLRCRRDSMSATRVSSRARYDGASECPEVRQTGQSRCKKR
jgi:hypothetical protein